MSDTKIYSAGTVFEGLRKTFHQYLEAQYHIWDEGLISERSRLLHQPGVTFQEPLLESTPSYIIGKPYQSLAIPRPAQEILMLASRRPNVGIYPEPYAHQSAALEAFLGLDEEIIVATGTGSGKTESFLMPILGSLAVESAQRPESWNLPGVRALLVYPMNALVNDQTGRLRRLLGDAEVAKALKGRRDRRATFGMYTSRTPYPGKSTPSKDRERIGTLLERLFHGLSAENQKLLENEGKWPVKDLERFVESSFSTGPEDSELFSRQEMQAVSPDLLVTNYSMLEYMLLRPIERSIFEQTAQWLASSPENRFIVVLDEAHMYRGSGGAEVAYLLRRLHSRLGADRNRVKYILTSASLGESEEAHRHVKLFAADLTGLEGSSRSFNLITGKVDKKPGARPATAKEARVLAEYDFTTLHNIYASIAPAEKALRHLFTKLDVKVLQDRLYEEELRNSINDWLQTFGPAALAANLITSRPRSLGVIAVEIFPDAEHAERSLESLLALMTVARERDTGRVFAPVRSHLFFRGLPGLFACVNPRCAGRVDTGKSGILGQLFSTPQLRCKCGARVYELLTHRDCGAAFIRGYLRDEYGDFLWHECSTGLWSDGGLLEAHFLVEVNRQSRQDYGKVEGSRTWLHMETGRLEAREPASEAADQYLVLLRPDGLVQGRSGSILTFNGECPVCVKGWQGATKIMDLMTKGEAPFAHLVREQVALQPAIQRPSDASPNEGRKALLFSDGRQKAARLARDIPREIEQDVFRQVLLLAAAELNKVGLEAVLSHWIYVACLDVIAKTGLQLFDGEDRHALQRDVREYRKWFNDDLDGAIRSFGSPLPPRFTALLHRQLGSPFYSVNALTLAYLCPIQKALRTIMDQQTRIEKDAALALAVIWLQGFANRFAFDPAVRPGIRHQAAGYPVTTGLEAKAGFSRRQQEFLAQRLGEFDSLTATLADALCESGERGDLFLAPKRVKLEVAVHSTWYQCVACTAISPVVWWGHCPNCLAAEIIPLEPAATTYLRARKAFWRDPVVLVLEGDEKPINLTVEEHTAQLSYRDVDEPNPTTEEFERRFRDILVRPNDTSIDVLSSTTTMEVGIDIGSLVAVGLRNVPPLRQNYQQRAGRAGRRGSAISTVLTYAQSSPHDNYYFENPERIIAGEPSLPAVDTKNPKIIERHVRAQLIQVFFHSVSEGSGNANIITMFGETWGFYVDEGVFSLQSFKNWVRTSDEVKECYRAIHEWLPRGFDREPMEIAEEFLSKLDEARPNSAEELDQSDENLIEFLFSHGFLPSYAFPRDLCALQIEEEKPVHGQRRVKIVQRPQQGLNIALSEYAPGRLVVVNKKTYRVGTVAASATATVVDRAERLFTGRRMYVHCTACLFTAGFLHALDEGQRCPLCQTEDLTAVTVIQPEVVYPDGAREVDEYDDEQVFTQATGAQLPIPEGEAVFNWEPFLVRGKRAFVRNQLLVMVNKGEEDNSEGDGFLVCSRCGKTSLDGVSLGPHSRDYLIEKRLGAKPPTRTCNGEFQRVYLGYSFSSDVLLFRIPIVQPFRFDPLVNRTRRPLADALQSFCEALVLAVGRVLDIDIREMNAGYRHIRYGDDQFADIFLYDTLSGGAGYATQAGQVFQEVFAQAESLLGQCDCNSSCVKCLRHYGNRFHHGSLDRFLALDLVRFIKEGRSPEVFDRTRQQTELRSLVQMLTLAGWKVSDEGKAPITVTRTGRSVGLWAYPSLVDPQALGFEKLAAAHAFSPYELSRDLPGAFAEVM
ncbi:MAG: DEAD/DEAH box helicase [Acidobacteriaceae bacterium]